MSIHPLIQQDQDYIISLRRWFHSHPELSMKEYQTAARIEAELNAIGVPTRRVGETGVLGILHGNRDRAEKLFFGRTPTPCPFRMRKPSPMPPSAPASCTPAATMPIPPPFWGQFGR